ncbi:hypothetical protein V6N11_071160 [Hibiscus sabdariffa]|uniref:Uncharacterized protein n=1 Tax=Hibiscus sabdariffa TaxID=183260 RepID=A0ABR2U028_9ROSI
MRSCFAVFFPDFRKIYLRWEAAVEIRPGRACHHFPIAAEVLAGRFALLSAHSLAPEQPSMIGTAFLSLAHSKTLSLKTEFICIPKYAKKSAK